MNPPFKESTDQGLIAIDLYKEFKYYTMDLVLVLYHKERAYCANILEITANFIFHSWLSYPDNQQASLSAIVILFPS